MQLSEWREALTRLQTDVSARPLKQDIDAMSSLVDKQLKLIKAKLHRLSRQLGMPASHTGLSAQPSSAGAAAATDAEGDAAVMKRQLVDDFSCLSCDKKLLFTRKQCVDVFRLQLLLVARLQAPPLASQSLESSLSSSSSSFTINVFNA